MAKNICKLYYKDYFREVVYELNNEGSLMVTHSGVERKNKELLDAELCVISNECMRPNNSIQLKVDYPGLITGVGIMHELGIKGEFKLGVHFDYTYGMPVIYGSSVKGALKSAFPCENDDKKIIKSKTEYIKKCLGQGFEKIDVEKLRDWMFEGIEKVEIIKDQNGREKKKKYYLSIYKRDIFFDAVIVKPYEKKGSDGRTTYKRILESDSITPHTKGPLKNPIPITFLKIASGVTMEFRFDLKPCKIGDVDISSEDKIRLFRQILLDFGIGAKTNVGYGQFSEIEKKV